MVKPLWRFLSGLYLCCTFQNYWLQWAVLAAQPRPALDLTMMESRRNEWRPAQRRETMNDDDEERVPPYYYCVVSLTPSWESQQCTDSGSAHSQPVDVRLNPMTDQDNLHVWTHLFFIPTSYRVAEQCERLSSNTATFQNRTKSTSDPSISVTKEFISEPQNVSKEFEKPGHIHQKHQAVLRVIHVNFTVKVGPNSGRSYR